MGLAFSCTSSKSPSLDWGQSFFSFQESDELFFKNVRQIHYRITTDAKEGYTIYTHNYWQKSQRETYPRVELFCDWRENRAKLRILWQNSPQSVLNDPGIFDKEEALLVDATGKGSAEIAYEIFQASKKGKEALLIKDKAGNFQKLWQDKAHQAAAKACMYDFIKLIGQY